MKFLSLTSKAAFVGTQMVARPHHHLHLLAHPSSFYGMVSSSSTSSATQTRAILGRSMSSGSCFMQSSVRSTSTRLFSSGGGDGGSDGGAIQLKNIGKEEMEEIVEDYEEGGREDSGYVIMDVRERNEVEYTGKVSPNTITLPLSLISEQNVFGMEDNDFEDLCGFPKPTIDETLVFSCAAGIRSVHAARFAAMNGYSKLINYTGGANQWFR